MFSSFLGVYLGLECIPAVLYAKSVFSFLRTGQTIFSGSCPVSYVLTSNAPKGPHFHIPSGLSLFLFSSSRGCEVHFIVALICISLMLNDVEHLFTCSLSHSGASSLEKCLLPSLAHVSSGFFFFLTELQEFFTYAHQSLLMCMIYQYILGSSCHFLDGVLQSTNVFDFDAVHLINCFLSFVFISEPHAWSKVLKS